MYLFVIGFWKLIEYLLYNVGTYLWEWVKVIWLQRSIAMIYLGTVKYVLAGSCNTANWMSSVLMPWTIKKLFWRLRKFLVDPAIVRKVKNVNLFDGRAPFFKRNFQRGQEKFP